MVNDPYLCETILTEANKFKFIVHPRSNKMYQDLKRQYWWREMNKNVTTFMAKCMTFQ